MPDPGSETPPTVLLTGFEPFGGDRINPSWEIARRLNGWEVVQAQRAPRRRNGQAAPPGGQSRALGIVRSVLLPCVFHTALDALDAALAHHRPTVVIGLGLAASRSDISVERVAINIDDARIPDNAGCQPVDQPVCPGAPAAYWSTLPIKAIVAALQEAGIAASVSQSAGTFVCNHVFFGLAHRLAGGMRRGGFIHVPWSAAPDEPRLGTGRAMDLETMIGAIRIAIRVTLTTEADLRLPGGALD